MLQIRQPIFTKIISSGLLSVVKKSKVEVKTKKSKKSQQAVRISELAKITEELEGGENEISKDDRLIHQDERRDGILLNQNEAFGKLIEIKSEL